MEENFRVVDVPVNKGVNRKELIEKLQRKFKYQRGSLPEGAEVPVDEMPELTKDEEKKLLEVAEKRVYKRYH